MNLKQYAVIKSQENVLPANEIVTEMDKVIPILWIGSEGQFCLIPKEVVQNLLDLYEQLQQTKDSEYKLPPLQIVWDQGIEISNEIGRALLSE